MENVCNENTHTCISKFLHQNSYLFISFSINSLPLHTSSSPTWASETVERGGDSLANKIVLGNDSKMNAVGPWLSKSPLSLVSMVTLPLCPGQVIRPTREHLRHLGRRFLSCLEEERHNGSGSRAGGRGSEQGTATRRCCFRMVQ